MRRDIEKVERVRAAERDDVLKRDARYVDFGPRTLEAEIAERLPELLLVRRGERRGVERIDQEEYFVVGRGADRAARRWTDDDPIPPANGARREQVCDAIREDDDGRSVA